MWMKLLVPIPLVGSARAELCQVSERLGFADDDAPLSTLVLLLANQITAAGSTLAAVVSDSAENCGSKKIPN
jgi:hypothetical protein